MNLVLKPKHQYLEKESVMICHRTTYMSCFYLTEEVLSTYYELPKYKELYESLEDKIKILHRSVNDSNSCEGIDSSLIDINDMLQITANHDKKKGLTDCIKTYENANRMIREAEDSINEYFKSAQSPQTSTLPSLNRSIADSSNSSSENSQENSDRFSNS